MGGGINGCGILLDAAQRGLRVLLVEKDDIASGTSGRSSKLIHGGLRYLRQMQLRVTRTSCRERDRLLALSPHLVEPLRFVYPSYRGDRTPGYLVEAGLWIYDRLTSTPDRHAQLTEDELAELAPGLPTEGLDRALAYTDARVDDARLTLAVAATGAAYGGAVLTRAAPEEGIRDASGRLAGLRIRDFETGRVHDVRASLVVNATGVWVDTLRHQLGLEGRRIRPSRGSHLLLRTESLPLRAALTVPSPDDGRPVFFVPHPEGVLLGTTDLFHDGPLDDPRPSREEIGYLVRAAAAAFPDHHLDEADVLGAFAGLRPILDAEADADDPSKASREEDVWEEAGLLSVAGGKLTTWRSTAEEAVDAALELLPSERTARVAPSRTDGTPLAGLAPRDLPVRLERKHAVTPDVASGMARRLGSLAWTAAAMASDRGDLDPLASGLDLSAAEVRAHLRFGAVVHLSDLLLRRSRLGMWAPDAARDVAPRVADLAAETLGWTATRREEELQRFGDEVVGWTLAGAGEGTA